MKTKRISTEHQSKLEEFPNFHRSGSIRGMKKLYYGKNALLVICGNYVYNVTAEPGIYNKLAH